MHDKRLWRWHAQGHHQLVIMQRPQCFTVTRDAHNKLGHKGFYSMLHALLDRFWWPSLADNVRWYIKSCHKCQIHQTTKVRIPPTVTMLAPLFRKVYVNTMFMPLLEYGVIGLVMTSSHVRVSTQCSTIVSCFRHLATVSFMIRDNPLDYNYVFTCL
jgi:hypothetical protein